MSAARRVRRAGRNLLIALVVGAVLIVAIVTAYVAGRTTASPTAASISAPAQSSVPGNPTSTSDAAPTGCLGGQQRDVAMLLRAQREATHTTFGAVEVASSFLRWAYQYPYPSAREANQVSDRVVAPTASSGFRDVAGSYRSAGDITGGQVPKGTPFYLSTTTGSWIVNGQSTADRVTVDVSAPYVINGELSSTKSAGISATLVWSGNGWQLLSEQAPDTSALRAGGTQFTAGC